MSVTAVRLTTLLRQMQYIKDLLKINKGPCLGRYSASMDCLLLSDWRKQLQGRAWQRWAGLPWACSSLPGHRKAADPPLAVAPLHSSREGLPAAMWEQLWGGTEAAAAAATETAVAMHRCTGCSLACASHTVFLCAKNLDT